MQTVFISEYLLIENSALNLTLLKNICFSN